MNLRKSADETCERVCLYCGSGIEWFLFVGPARSDNSIRRFAQILADWFTDVENGLANRMWSQAAICYLTYRKSTLPMTAWQTAAHCLTCSWSLASLMNDKASWVSDDVGKRPSALL